MPPLTGILKNAPPLPKPERTNSLPSYAASTSGEENPLVELKRLLSERAPNSLPMDTASALASALSQSQIGQAGMVATDLSGVQTSLSQLNTTLENLNTTMQAQNRRIERIEKLNEDLVKLGIEQRTHARANAITQARVRPFFVASGSFRLTRMEQAYNAQMVRIANELDQGARFAPLEEGEVQLRLQLTLLTGRSSHSPERERRLPFISKATSHLVRSTPPLARLAHLERLPRILRHSSSCLHVLAYSRPR
jgi:hypothetical protein